MFSRSARGARAITVAAIALATAPASALAQSSPAPLQPAATPAVIPGQYIVVLKTGKGAGALAGLQDDDVLAGDDGGGGGRLQRRRRRLRERARGGGRQRDCRNRDGSCASRTAGKHRV